MKSKFNYFEQIQAYLSDEMAPQQREEFEAELGQNSSLKRELLFQKKLNTIIMDDELEQFKNELDNIHKEVAPSTGRKRSINFGRYTLIAASLLVLVSLSIFLIMNGSGSSKGEHIFIKYYEKYAPDYTTRAYELSAYESKFAEAYKNYKSNEYGLAKPVFESLIQSQPGNFAAKFYLGAIYLELNEMDSAIIQFDAVIVSNDQFYLEHSEWFKALSTLKLGEIKSAIDQFKLIANQKGYYQTRAEGIISELQ
ncbi:MAG: hypothetical protein CVU00_12405 [Bacteroidetes bacterium HGW-Bacteroidetes-17]|jgi:tetratricopeptide (TPR) repeat protein|nr:MAG: hypothetical protein CVU00_12405 [Bacteroidetes bacterium HGW-Bacteroidetes-17]